MSIGNDLMATIVAGEERLVLGEINPEWLTTDEREVFDFVMEHMRRHGSMPTFDTLDSAGHELPDPRDLEPYSYYLQELPRRAIHQRYRDSFPSMADMLENRQVEPLLTEMRELLDFATFQTSSMAVSSIQHEVAGLTREVRSLRQHGLLGVTTGYPTLNEMTDGFQGGDLAALVGRPSMGKSYLLFNMANEAWKAGKSVLIVTMEMLVRQCSRRILALNTGVNPNDIRNGHIDSFTRTMINTVMSSFHHGAPLNFVAGDFRKTVADIDILVQELNPDILFVDSAYLLQPSSNKRRNSRREYISDTFEELKSIAMNRDKPVVVSTQFNRTKKTGRGASDLSQIAESDAIGQLVSVALGVSEGGGQLRRRRREIALMKNREGSVCQFDTAFSFNPVNFSEVQGSKREVAEYDETSQRPRSRRGQGPTGEFQD